MREGGVKDITKNMLTYFMDGSIPIFLERLLLLLITIG